VFKKFVIRLFIVGNIRDLSKYIQESVSKGLATALL